MFSTFLELSDGESQNPSGIYGAITNIGSMYGIFSIGKHANYPNLATKKIQPHFFPGILCVE